VTLLAFLSPDGKITITVEDNGIGIVEEALGKIFIPFFTTKKNGSGIGLSLSRQILRLHNATISAKSKPDEGSLFTLRFA
jgi:signal transduction histidine kinase